MNKKYITSVFIIAIGTFFLFWIQQPKFTNKYKEGQITDTKSATISSEKTNGQVKVILDFGDQKITATSVSALNAFEALERAVTDKNLPLKTKKYDFGIFIESIGDYPNTTLKSWIYYINGKSATQAADLQEVKTGDVIEWKYEKPIY